MTLAPHHPRWNPVTSAGVPVRSRGFLDGRVVTGSATADIIEVEDPAYGLPLMNVVDSDASQVDEAVADADHAQKGVWGHTSPADRGRILFACASEIRRQATVLSTIECIDTGKAISQARKDVETAARYFEFYAGLADKIGGETIPTRADELVYTRREPFGVVAHVTPWNSPLSQMARGVAPSLAGGNTVVVKPSAVTPLSTLVAARVLVEAGLPGGVCNVVVGRGATAGAALVAHPSVGHVTFTGSVQTGRLVMASASERVIPCSLELGGKSPTIVMPDADLDAAALAGASSAIRNSGQSCVATTRMLVHSSIYDRFIELCAARMSRLTLGHGLDDPDLGPLSSSAQYERVKGLVERAVADGARLACGGPDARPSLKNGLEGGHFFPPTLLVNVHNSMEIAQQEVFGPVQCVIPFSTEAEALAIANDTVYGLAAGIFTRDLSAAHRLAAQLQAGQVQINRFPAGGAETPFGGYKQSGIGREKGVEALRHYTQLKTVILALNGPIIVGNSEPD